MATINDYGQADQPLSGPALDQWAAAVAAALNVLAYRTATLAPPAGWTGTIAIYRQGHLVTIRIKDLHKTGSAPTAYETICTLPPGYTLGAGYSVPLHTIDLQLAQGTGVFLINNNALQVYSPAVAQAHWASGTQSWHTADAMPA